MLKDNIEIAIIGAGASGLMCALRLAEGTKDTHITLYERNAEIGKKIRISGGGRCNFTTGREEKSSILGAYIRGSAFLKFGMGKYPPKKIRDFFASHGVESHVEEDLRVFPQSNKSSDIIGVFDRSVEFHPHLTLKTKHQLKKVAYAHSQFGLLFGDSTETVYADIVILTTGGNAYVHTGSTGDGYEFAQGFGHNITPLSPSLNSFETEAIGEDYSQLQGVVLKQVTFRKAEDATPLAVGDMIFTHFGISGPGVFALAANLAYMPIENTSPYQIMCGLTSKSFDIIEQEFIECCAQHPKKSLSNILHMLYPLPERFEKYFWNKFQTEMSQTGSIISKEVRKNILHHIIRGWSITLTKRRAGDEFVTAGGVETSEVSNKTCESKIQKNLYFAGEILNIDGITGGFNFQSCWVTASLVSDAIIERLHKDGK